MKVLIVDDHQLVRQGLATLLQANTGITIVGEASSADETIEAVRTLSPDVVLLDLYLGQDDGSLVARQIRTEFPNVKIVILSMSDSDDDLFRALRAGAHGYIVKNTDLSSLVTSIEWVANGQVALSRRQTARLVARLQETTLPVAPPVARPEEKPALSRLSQREHVVLSYIAAGASNKEIARRLALSEHTVRTHITNILAKLGFANRVQAAAWAIRHEILPADRSVNTA
ncbi:MAG: response regulator transcription factor [Dehalococcoidia bacterium]